MRDPTRIPVVLEEIRKAWSQSPDLRLCQLLSNVARTSGWDDNDLFYLEDDQLRAGLRFENAAIADGEVKK